MRLDQKLVSALVSISRAELPSHLVISFYVADRAARKHLRGLPEWETLSYLSRGDVGLFKGTIRDESGHYRFRIAIRHDLPGEVRFETGPMDGKSYDRETRWTLIDIMK